MTTAPTRPKRRDYTRVARAAAEATLAKQTAAHVAVLEAEDEVNDAAEQVTAAQARHADKVRAHAQALTEFADLIGTTEAAHRLDLDVNKVRAAMRATRTPATTDTPAEAPSGGGSPSTDAD